jgi:glutamate synthase domain-containing protein 2/glutamate synthase domain-containing protein 1/glutamate synthase domain-containing protein 3
MKSRYYNESIPNEGSLHSLEREHDACGVGFVANIHGVASHQVLRYGVDSVCAVTHRGAVDADGKTGDGAGVSTQIPFKLLQPWLKENGVSLASADALGVGMVFLPLKDEAQQLKGKVLIEGILRKRGVPVYGWRDVPVNPEELGQKALATMPSIQQVIFSRPDGIDGDTLERILFLARREIELISNKEVIDDFYIISLSGRMVGYKGLMVASALDKFYSDLTNEDYETAICLYHQRFSTNTFPTWPLGQPFRMLAHNGEINTVRGNRNWLNSRSAELASEVWGDEDAALLKDLLDPKASDSASLDGALELLVLSGRSLEHAMTMLVPPAWRIDPETSPEEEAFYKYHRCFSEPWDGPAALVFTDGITVGASLDRNGLRPLRVKQTKDGILTVGSEVGVVELDDETVISKGRLAPGEMIAVNTTDGIVRTNREIKKHLARQQPYAQWLKDNRIDLDDHISPNPTSFESMDAETLVRQQIAHGYNDEELKISFTPVIQSGNECVYSMGDDTPLSVLSRQPRVLPTYFKQLFAQVTNPPIDPIRERLVMSITADLGPERNLLKETAEHARVIHLESPFLFPHQMETLKTVSDEFPAQVFDYTWPVSEGEAGMQFALEKLSSDVVTAVDSGTRLIILSDRAICKERVAIPALLAVGAVHQHLIKTGRRMKVSLIVESGEARDTHQMACLFGYGVTAICPYLGCETISQMLADDPAKRKPDFEGVDILAALKNYRSSLEKGVLKIMSKMGISVLNSYQGAQIFEAIGIGKEVIKRCFDGTPSQLDGIGFEQIAAESLTRHEAAWNAEPDAKSGKIELGDPGFIHWRRAGEMHSVSGPVIKNFHTFVRSGKAEDYDEYLKVALENRPVALHNMFEFKPLGPAIPIEEVEPIEAIRIRFTTAAMSMGALSPEAHETLAVAMNRIGGKSDSGEGGEEARRFKPYPNGDSGNSKIKQVASGRFGVNTAYLASAEEIEIKMAQGAKPGEGGQLPGHKVNGIIARLRHTQPGVQLISPPPHHDIYSIEDLAQLIHDLKEVNPRARVCVKLVAETGVGTIAAGVAKANADIILVSGHDGGTGASPLSSIKHAGLPWEIGVAETQQVLRLNNLRDRVTLRTDGGLRTGRDIISAALLGAEEFNFGTIALIAMGCVYVRKCHLNTCPVGIATQDPKYRVKFKGTADHVVNFFNAVSHEAREIMASLGVRKMEDIIGRPDLIEIREVPDHPKANMLDFSRLLKDVGADLPRSCRQQRNDGLHAAPLDDQIIADAQVALIEKKPVNLTYSVKNTNRNIGTKLAGEIAHRYGNHGMRDETITLNLTGSAGQSFGTFLCGGVKIILTGEANDYVGKGMCGGEIIVRPPAKRGFVPADNSIIGNTVLYGSTGGFLFANGKAGERFCVRNSGGTAVVEGCGDHGCEYMTNGISVILGQTGKNFGAGMSGGLAFIYDESGNFNLMLNDEMVESHPLDDPEDQNFLKGLINRHLQSTESEKAKMLLDNWEAETKKFRVVRPKASNSVLVPKPAVAAVK